MSRIAPVVAPVFASLPQSDLAIEENASYFTLVVALVCRQSRDFLVCRRVTRRVHNAFAFAFMHSRSRWCVLLFTPPSMYRYSSFAVLKILMAILYMAFDVVPHQRLLHKLDHYRIRGPTLLWIRNFLTTRTQKVVVDGSFSNTAHVGSGVPQGTVLGPILFPCYINDLPSSVSSYVRLFADDCLLYRPIKSKDDQKKLQEDLTKLERWADIWGMKFNPSKCSVLRVKRPRAKEIASDYQLKGVTLGQVTNSPYLGVSISENLEWGDHISKIASKANSTLGFLRRNLKGCPSKLKEIAYFSMVRSLLEYSCPVWDPYRQGDIDKLNKIQRAAARL